MVKKKSLKSARNQKEAVEYIESHGLTGEDFEGLEEVKFDIATQKGRVVSIRFPPEVAEQLSKIATKKGLGFSTMVRMWVMERLENEQRPELKVSTGGRK